MPRRPAAHSDPSPNPEARPHIALAASHAHPHTAHAASHAHPRVAHESFLAGAARSLGVVAGFLGFGLALSAGLGGALSAAPLPVSPPPGAAGPYTGGTMQPAAGNDAARSPQVWLVDGFNLLHTSLLGGEDRTEWWREPGRRRVLEAVSRFEDPEAEIWVVFDGPRPAKQEDRDGPRPAKQEDRDGPRPAKPEDGDGPRATKPEDGDGPQPSKQENCDAPLPAKAAGRAGERVRVVFAPSADAWLATRARSLASDGEVAVVTADRSLAGRARHRGAQVVAPRDFLARCPG